MHIKKKTTFLFFELFSCLQPIAKEKQETMKLLTVSVSFCFFVPLQHRTETAAQSGQASLGAKPSPSISSDSGSLTYRKVPFLMVLTNILNDDGEPESPKDSILYL